MSQEEVQQRRDKFEHQMETLLEEIDTKCKNLRNQLDKSEEELRDYVRTIKSDTLLKFDQSFPGPKSSLKIQDSINSSLTDDDSNIPFFDVQLEDCDSQINGILRKTGIEDTIKLKWKIRSFEIDNICEIETHKFSIVESSSLGKKKRDKITYRVHDCYREGGTPRGYMNSQISSKTSGIHPPYKEFSVSSSNNSDATQISTYYTTQSSDIP